MATIRPAAVAGRFYPATTDGCERMIDEMLVGVNTPAARGAIVPHAGWIYSGSTAALALAGIAAAQPEIIIIIGTVHTPDPNPASVFGAGAWDTPLGPIQVDERLAARLSNHRQVVDCPAAHRREHSIEVQLPIIQRLLPNATVVPVSVRPGPQAVEIGQFFGSVVAEYAQRVAVVGTTDLTHYGPIFDFEPHGHGELGIRWAKEVNDRRLIRLIQTLDAAAVVPEAIASRNACGPGAVAATIAAMREVGAKTYTELRHTCSAEAGAREDRDEFNSVGYESGVFTPPP